MTPHMPSPGDLIGQLLEILDEEIRLLDLRRDQLAQLGSSLARRDETGTERLLDQIEQAQEAQQQTDARLASNRTMLAQTLGWTDGELRLADLIDALPAGVSIAVSQRRSRIIELAEQVKNENLKAAMVLAECAHLNHLMLQAIMPPATQVDTYGSGGHATWRSGAGLVDARG
jgi:flagellar biosynthesis/type III secretory pathway chaperone